ncbi:MFS general substrate transporter [Ophiobolus disseminans]|uniref:MFS general substrate transporter n=1 Tax=Ophiobolus disseminans TaxID=1469910 RepID=A0A6A6ZZV2_9PLEO|nr:MFS general substrate transporter [Ophiobolus disseminans]
MPSSEIQPLLSATHAKPALYNNPSKQHDVEGAIVIDLTDDPKTWSKLVKWRIILILSLMAFNVSFSCIAVVPISNHILCSLDSKSHSKSASVLLVTAWELGEAIGPLLLAPLSELTGRLPALHLANAVFIVAHVLAALSKNLLLLILARAVAGLAVATTVLNPAIVGDMFVMDQRGSAMAVLTVAPILGAALGPGISGCVTQTLGWRYVFWMSVFMAGISQVLLLSCFRETHRVVKTPVGIVKQSLRESITKPIAILYSSRTLKALCLSHGMAFAVYCIMTVTLPDIFERGYDQSMSGAGLSFMSYTTGSCVSILLCHATLDRISKRLGQANNSGVQPEYRLPLASGGALLLPACIVLYGWATVIHLSISIMLLCLALLGIMLTLFSTPIFAYIVDAFGDYSASATAGVIMTRGLMGVLVPLAVGPVIEVLGYGWSFTMLGASCLILSLLPLVMVMHEGGKWRQWIDGPNHLTILPFQGSYNNMDAVQLNQVKLPFGKPGCRWKGCPMQS